MHAPGLSPAAILALQRTAGNHATTACLQRAAARNETGLPDDLRAGVEALSGVSLEGVRVHYRSTEPTEVGAHAFARRDEIHVAAGQERHLPHEAWHIVQQRQSRVRPTAAVNGQAVNDDAALEREAVTMGERAVQRASAASAAQPALRRATSTTDVLQGAWVDAAKINGGADAIGRDPLGALLLLSDPYRESHGPELAMLVELRRDPGNNADHLAAVGKWLTDALASGLWETGALMSGAAAAGADNDPVVGDDELDADAVEIRITFENFDEYVDPMEVESSDEGIRAIFGNMARDLGKVPTEETYRNWYTSSARFTRTSFARLFDAEEHADPMQMARVAGALSYQANYASSAGNTYTKVTYKLGKLGSIDFATPQSSSKWTNPVDSPSWVDLEKGCKKKGHGLTKNGTAVPLKTASRGQHFSVANRIQKRPEAGSPAGWTWHHDANPYRMVLVDRVVHSKHGHNGGVYIW